MKRYYPLLFCVALGCQEVPSPEDSVDDTATPEVSDSSAFTEGQSVDELKGRFFEYDTVSKGADVDTPRYGTWLCQHARLGGTTVVAEVQNGVRNLTEGVPDCERDYSEPAQFIPLEILGNAAGETLPKQLDTTFLFFDWNLEPPVPGERVLVTIREDADEWFWLGWVPLKVTTSAKSTEPELSRVDRTDLPTTFAALSTELRALKVDPAATCGGESPDDLWGWPDAVRDPSIFYASCRDGYVPEPAEGYPERP